MKKIKSKSKQSIKLKGQYKFTIATLDTKYQKWLNTRIENLRKDGKKYLHLVEKLNSICKVKIIYAENIITTAGLTLIANNLADSTPANEMRISHCAVGSGTTAPALGDTTLETETYRNTVASQINSGAVVYNTMFISATDDDGTYREFGLFSDASLTPDSGVLFAHLAINITKSNTQTLTIDHTLTLSNA